MSTSKKDLEEFGLIESSPFFEMCGNTLYEGPTTFCARKKGHAGPCENSPPIMSPGEDADPRCSLIVGIGPNGVTRFCDLEVGHAGVCKNLFIGAPLRRDDDNESPNLKTGRTLHGSRWAPHVTEKEREAIEKNDFTEVSPDDNEPPDFDPDFDPIERDSFLGEDYSRSFRSQIKRPKKP